MLIAQSHFDDSYVHATAPSTASPCPFSGSPPNVLHSTSDTCTLKNTHKLTRAMPWTLTGGDSERSKGGKDLNGVLAAWIHGCNSLVPMAHYKGQPLALCMFF